jgi:ATP-dependent helicase HepA
MVATEFVRIRAQDTIDSFDTDVVTQEFADELENNDRKLAQKSVEIFAKWLKHGLHFRISGEEQRCDDVFQYEFTRRVDYGRRGPYGKDTLIPIDEFKRFFATSIDNIEMEKPVVFTTVPLTFDRVTSQLRSCRLLRVGDPFVDAMESFTRWDDRGCNYAFWRYVPSYRGEVDPAVFFKFDFVVSPAVAPLKALCERYPGASWNAVLRRTQTIMQPRFTTMWLDSDLERVSGQDDRANLLTPAFSKGRSGLKEDFNLNRNRWDAATELYHMSLWRDRCAAARETSERLLREQSGLPKWSSECVEKAARLGNQIQQQFRSRLAISNVESKSSLAKDLRFERDLQQAQVEAFMNPDLRVDSVGAIFISNRMPFNDVDGREDDD